MKRHVFVVFDGSGAHDVLDDRGGLGLLAREEGLDTCFQEAWAVYAPQIREMVDIPEDHTFFCGVAIGYRDEEAAVNNFAVKRAGIEESVRWEGW